ncbi:putative ribonuclease H2 subunit C [Paecilomyces variotii]|uniref:Putative ribonuclease H2 subunit C n=1 Tax=Byssochlamys spectabilis TaxID=264951 RepID=A0A443HSC3_BYSSP|nr:putative ribonuclease H2 subunit C [Paecilomyces variotii]RWQ94715.1 putative ribonuclease H2 subunit C [Paecilomyces variotii]
MFALQSAQSISPETDTQSSNTSTPNILPCRIHHDGPLESLERYWKPLVDENGIILLHECLEFRTLRSALSWNITRSLLTHVNYEGDVQTAHFRGRKLRARRVAIPEGYKGVVAMPTDRVLHPKTNRKAELQNGEQDEEREEPVKVLETQATFDEFVVWGHEIMPAADDPFVKGVEEWIKFAEAVILPDVILYPCAAEADV